MKARLSLLLGAILLAQHARAASQLENAIAPLDQGVPQVAVVRLQDLLKVKLTSEERTKALGKLGEALVAANQPEEALRILNDPVLREAPETKFFQAQALAASGRWPEALTSYRAAATQKAARFSAEALVGEAEALRALGRIDEALSVYGQLMREENWKTRTRLRSAELLLRKDDAPGAMRMLETAGAKTAAERKEIRLLRARIESRLGRRKRAMELFAWILKHPEGAAHSVLITALFGIADEHLNAGTPGSGDDFLEDFIERYPEDVELPAIFAKLDQLYAAERRQTRHELGRWSRDPAQPRRALARWYLARAELRIGRRDMAERAFAELVADPARIPQLIPGLIEYAQLKMEERAYDQALSILERARTLSAQPNDRIEFLAGEAHYRASRFEPAAQTFQRVALRGGERASDALYNVSLAWMQTDEKQKGAEAEQELKQRGADEATRGEVALEKGLLQARQGEKTAAESLQNFIRNFPQHPRLAEAWVALAELAFHAAPPRLDEARRNLAQAAESHPTPAAEEASDYLQIWLEEGAAPPSDNKVIERAAEFLQKHRESGSAAEVRLKLGETFYRREDFASAQTQFTLLAQQNPKSPLAEKAQFFAARSAMKSMGVGSLDRALVLFGEVVKKDGEFKWAARNEQAVIERKLGKSDDALTLYEEVLKGDGKTVEKREALCAKGDIYYDLGPADPENYRRAIGLYEQLAAQTDTALHWHNQALFKKGMCLEKLNEPAEALTAFYGIIEDGSRPDRRREFFWFYKAGFNAARLLEEQSSWQPAAAIYEKLAFAGGSRSEEAKSRLNRIRLEHFLWEE